MSKSPGIRQEVVKVRTKTLKGVVKVRKKTLKGFVMVSVKVLKPSFAPDYVPNIHIITISKSFVPIFVPCNAFCNGFGQDNILQRFNCLFSTKKMTCTMLNLMREMNVLFFQS